MSDDYEGDSERPLRKTTKHPNFRNIRELKAFKQRKSTQNDLLAISNDSVANDVQEVEEETWIHPRTSLAMLYSLFLLALIQLGLIFGKMDNE